MDRNPKATKYIDMKTAIPGPQSQVLLERRMANGGVRKAELGVKA